MRFISLRLVLIITVFSLLFTSCGKADNFNQKEVSNGKTDEVKEEIKGEVVTREGFSVFAPEGWFVIPVSDSKPNHFQIHKGAKDEFAAYDRPGLSVTYYGPESSNYPPPKDFYENVEELDTLVIGDLSWEGFYGEFSDGPLLILWVEGEKEPIEMQMVVWLKIYDREITIEDDDVKAIIESIKIL